MKKLLLIASALLLTSLGMAGFASSASAYPETSCDVSVSAQIVNAGDNFTATGTAQQTTTGNRSARAAAAAVTWTVTFNGEVRHATGSTFRMTFKAPSVTTKTTFPLTAKAVMPDATTHCQRTVDITVEPGGIVSPPGGCTGLCLPNTGGPRLAILIAGVALLVGGAYAVRQSRAKSSSTPSSSGGRHT